MIVFSQGFRKYFFDDSANGVDDDGNDDYDYVDDNDYDDNFDYDGRNVK